jgi:hypothetical protein
VTNKGSEQKRSKTAGQLAYEAAGDWVVKHPDCTTAAALPRWETLDARAREYWDMIGSAVRAPLIAAIGALVTSEGRPTLGEVNPTKAIRGLWAVTR